MLSARRCSARTVGCGLDDVGSSRAAESGHHASSVTRIGLTPLPTAEKRRGRRSAPAIGDSRAPNCLALLGQPCEEAVGPRPTKPRQIVWHWLHVSEKCQTDLSCPRDPELPLSGPTCNKSRLRQVWLGLVCCLLSSTIPIECQILALFHDATLDRHVNVHAAVHPGYRCLAYSCRIPIPTPHSIQRVTSPLEPAPLVGKILVISVRNESETNDAFHPSSELYPTRSLIVSLTPSFCIFGS